MRTCIFVLLAVIFATHGAYAQAPQDPLQSDKWRDFERVVKGQFGSESVDLACEQVFDSADPMAMATELIVRRNANKIFDNLSARLGLSADSTPQNRLQEEQWLRQTALHKIWLPVAMEDMLGTQLHQALVQQGAVIEPGSMNPRDTLRLSRMRNLLSSMVAALPQAQPYVFRIFVTREKGSSISAQMGGYVYVSEGLLRDRSLNDDDLALRLAHEMSHVTKRHVLRDFQTKFVDAYVVGQQTEQDWQRLTDGRAMLQLVMQRFTLTQTLSKKFSLGNELEADSCAIPLMKKVMTGPAINGAIDKFSQSQTIGGGLDADVSTHPRSDARAKIMRLQMARL